MLRIEKASLTYEEHPNLSRYATKIFRSRLNRQKSCRNLNNMLNDPKPETAHVVVPLPLAEGFDYSIPPGVAVREGLFVEVPLGGRKTVGVVWRKGRKDIPDVKLKPIGDILAQPALPETTLRFVDWVADYTLSPRGSLLKMVMGGRPQSLLAKDSLDMPEPIASSNLDALTPEQHDAAEHLMACVQARKFSVTLLDGVTGSGKTEVYAEALAEALRQGRQTLVLLPEIAMTAALIGRLTERFGVRPVEWHSDLTPKQRRINWHAIAQGKARFILGARSALFLPYPDLGLIVVDEEHEAAYKQEEGVIYHGRDMAVVLACLNAIPVVLASATPSLESLHNVQKGKYAHVMLRSRYGKAGMPSIKLIDLRKEKMPIRRFISDPLLEAMKKSLADGQQAMLFLNRRGYAPLTLCRKCGHRLNCPNCTSWLTEHRKAARLRCHHCDHSIPYPSACPQCKAQDSLAACGPGVERIAEEVAVLLPEARVAVMASDTLSGPKEAERIVSLVQNNDVNLLIGTQIMTKGYHFPRLTVVGVIDGDLGLGGGDPRAAERTFQLLQQVAGRSGRDDVQGHVYLQTVSPEHPVMKALIGQDRDSFLAAELRERSLFKLPPYSRLATITVSGKEASQVIALARKIASSAPRNDALRLLGPAPAPYSVLRGKTRYRILVQTRRDISLSSTLRTWLTAIKTPRTLRIQVDIDPHSFL